MSADRVDKKLAKSESTERPPRAGQNQYAPEATNSVETLDETIRRTGEGPASNCICPHVPDAVNDINPAIPAELVPDGPTNYDVDDDDLDAGGLDDDFLDGLDNDEPELATTPMRSGSSVSPTPQEIEAKHQRIWMFPGVSQISHVRATAAITAKESPIDKSAAYGYTRNMTIEQYRHWLQKKIKELDHPEPDIGVCEGAATIVEEAAATALVLGLPDLYRKSKFKGQRSGRQEGEE